MLNNDSLQININVKHDTCSFLQPDVIMSARVGCGRLVLPQDRTENEEESGAKLRIKEVQQ
jgi:hypothetical protein